MIIDIITLFPELMEETLKHGVIGRARTKGIYQTRLWNPRDYTEDVHKTVDDRPYGGGPGMVMKYAPLKSAFKDIATVRGATGLRIYPSPRGQLFNQRIAEQLAQAAHLVFLCGRYEGVDERLINTEVDLELSLGDYVVSGGEIPVAAMIDAVVRLLPNVLSNQASHQNDSFSDEGLLDCPHYTRPEEIDGMRVPEVLLSGDHTKIAAWRRATAVQQTQERRPDLFDTRKI